MRTHTQTHKTEIDTYRHVRIYTPVCMCTHTHIRTHTHTKINL